MRTMWLWILVGGCGWFTQVKDTVEGVVEPIVAVGLVTVFESPDIEGLDEELLGVGVGGTVFLADARSVSDLEEAPVTGAALEVAGCGHTEAMDESASGTYTLAPEVEFQDCDGPTFAVTRTDVSAGLRATLTIPDAPSLDVPERWTAGAALTLPLAGAAFDSALVVLWEIDTGAIVFSNEPTEIRGYYDLLMGTGDIEDVVIPGEAFAEDATYALVVTGLVKTPNREIDEVNTVLSVLDGGRARAWGLTTVQAPD